MFFLDSPPPIVTRTHGMLGLIEDLPGCHCRGLPVGHLGGGRLRTEILRDWANTFNQPTASDVSEGREFLEGLVAREWSRQTVTIGCLFPRMSLHRAWVGGGGVGGASIGVTRFCFSARA